MLKHLFLFAIFTTSTFFSQPFYKGVNLTNWFQSNTIREVQFTKYTFSDFQDIKSLGVDVIRLPINLHNFTSGSPNYEIDPLFYYFIDQVADWAEQLEIHLILDNHTFDPAIDTPYNIDEALLPIWTQMAEHFKNRSEFIYYEILNEPHGISDARWNEIQLSVVQTIRSIDSVHTIVVGPAGWNSYNNLDLMPEYPFENLIYTFHFYDPFLFTHQGASWTSPSLESLAGMPFPYNQSEMPELPPEYYGTWVESSFNNYYYDGAITRICETLNIPQQFQIERNAPVFCGEFGVFKPNSENEHRVYWYNIARQCLEAKNLSWTIWDYQGGFGLFEDGTPEQFDYDFNVDLLEALGFNVPPQSDFEVKPDSTSIPLYGDYVEQGINLIAYPSGTLDFYNDENPQNGEFSIYWTDASQYENIMFDFIQVRDLTYLKNQNYVFSFWLKGNNPSTQFEIRFIDTKTNVPGDHPWRCSYKINAFATNFDNEWHKVEINLNDFYETGSWDDGWFDEQGDFDWSQIERFEIVAEYGNITSDLWFDDIKIYNPNSVGNYSFDDNKFEFKLYDNYPNPFNPSTRIKFSIPNNNGTLQETTLSIYNTLGQKVAELLKKHLTSGIYEVEFRTENLPSGVYFYRLQTGQDFIQTKKMLLIK